MILGMGHDLCDARRIKSSVERFGARFLDRVFTANEQAYALSKAPSHLSFAKRFAAKEAVAKALGTGVRGFFWPDIEVVSASLGKPEVLLYKGAKDRLDALCPDGFIPIIHLSLSDEDPYASAYVVIEARPKAF